MGVIVTTRCGRLEDVCDEKGLLIATFFIRSDPSHNPTRSEFQRWPLVGESWLGGSEACDEDPGLPAGELVPVGRVRERLSEHRSGDDDVGRFGVRADGPVAASAGEDLFEQVPDFGLKRDDLLVVDDRAAVEGQDEFAAGRDRLFEELGQCRGSRVVALGGGARVLQDEVEGAQRQSRQRADRVG